MRPTALLILLAFVAGAAGGFLFSRRPPPAAPPVRPAAAVPAREALPPATAAGKSDSPEPDLAAAGPERTLEVDVRMPDGTAPAEATLDLVGCGGRPTADRWGLPWTPDRRTVDLPPGPGDVVARAGAGGEFASEPRQVWIPWTGRAAPVVLTLAAVRGIRGRVLVPDATCVAGLSVEARAEADQERVNKAAPDPTRGFAYALRGLPPGRYLLTLTGLGEPGPPVAVAVSEGMAEQDLALRLPSKEASLLLRPVGPDGRPVPVSAIDRWSGAPSDVVEGDLDFATLSDGSCAVALPPPDERSLVAVCRVSSPAFGGRKLRLPPENGGEVAVRFEEPAFLLVTIANAPAELEEDGHSLWDVSLVATDDGDAADRVWRALTGPEVRFGPVQPGPYELGIRSELSIAPEGDTTGTVARVPVRLSSGENRLSVPFPTLHDLTVVLPEGALEYASDAKLTAADGTEFAGRDAMEGGSVAFHGLPTGRYVFELQANERFDGRMEVYVPAAGPVSYAPSWPGGLVVSLPSWLTGSDDAEALGLRDGDVMVEVGGNTFANAAEGRALLELAGPEEATELTILRGSERVKIRVPGALLDRISFETPLKR